MFCYGEWTDGFLSGSGIQFVLTNFTVEPGEWGLPPKLGIDGRDSSADRRKMVE
jgi:hypothetical protein